ncbi:18912_t:CDS:2 [Gigaspora rosea]|nr:18912_t:CDS:2 [Gigaspora rosea]
MNPISVSSVTEKPDGDAVNQCSIMYTVSGPGAPVTEDPYGGAAILYIPSAPMGYVRYRRSHISLLTLGYVRLTKISGFSFIIV